MSDAYENDIYPDTPWKDGDLLERLYIDERMSMNDIRKEWDCSLTTVSTWIDKHGIDKRSRSEAAMNMHGFLDHVSYYTRDDAHEIWRHLDHIVLVHRLLAYAEFGLDAMRGKEVHHKNFINWDNRAENLELLTAEEHQKKHLKVRGIDRMRIAEFYEHGDISSRKLADHVHNDICSTTVLGIHKEFYGS